MQDEPFLLILLRYAGWFTIYLLPSYKGETLTSITIVILAPTRPCALDEYGLHAHTYPMHQQNEVNAIQWAPYPSSKRVLASCSDDHTAKVQCAACIYMQLIENWSVTDDSCALLCILYANEIFDKHEKCGFRILPTRWDGRYHNMLTHFVSGTVCMHFRLTHHRMCIQVWSLDQDSCVHTLAQHSKEIFQLKWCPKPDAIMKSEGSQGQICGFLATSVTSH